VLTITTAVRLLVFLCMVVGANAVAGSTRAAVYAGAQIRPIAPTALWTRYWDVRVRANPGGAILTILDLDQEVRGTATEVGGDGQTWYRVRLWGAMDGWIQAPLLSNAPVPKAYVPGVAEAPNPIGPHSPMPIHVRAITITTATVRDAPAATAGASRLLATGTILTIDRWATDITGRAWYGLKDSAAAWIEADSAQTLPVGHLASLKAIHGLGMWLTPPVLGAASPESIVSAAVKNHITHLYVEVAGSRGWSGKSGFYGKATLGKLLPVAHRAHVAVIAWVYPYLNDLPSDVEFSAAAARYVAPSGDRPDGLIADVEQNMQEPYVRAYGQIVRARLGPKVLMMVATYPPQSAPGKVYPFRTVARTWDVIVPMDYWNVARRPYSEAEAYSYVSQSIIGVRKATGIADEPIEVLGQMFDAFGDGRHSPTLAEIRGSLRAARDRHALSISFFEWNHATPEEWDALRASES
jgi:hypothetical protein